MANFVQPGHYDGSQFVADQFRAQDIVAISGVTAEAHISNAGIHLTTDQIAAINGAIQSALLGAANGVATLDANMKLTLSQLPPSVTGGLNYQDTFNATTGEDAEGNAIPSPVTGNKGWFWIASVAGDFTPPGAGAAINFAVGDWLVSNGDHYAEVDNTTVDNVARAAAATAQTAAENAQTAANNAQTTANDATTAAGNAQTTANNAIPATQKGAANGVASLDANTKVPLTQTYLEFLYAATTTDITNNAANLKDGALVFLVVDNT
jgi:hypothetical protein